MDIQHLDNFRLAFHNLGDRVRVAVRTVPPQAPYLCELREQCFRLLAASQEVRYFPSSCLMYSQWVRSVQNSGIFPQVEYRTLVRSVNAMATTLDHACQHLTDQPDSRVSLLSYEQRGTRGRPRIHIDRQFLSFALEVRGPIDVAKVLGCHSRTVRKRAVEYGILPPGAAPFQNAVRDDGTVTRIRIGSMKHTRMSDISDLELDNAIAGILRDFPDFGRRMIDGRLRAQGILVSRARRELSYLRIHGPPPLFRRPPLVRREYWVAGVNSMWHHDGQHGEDFDFLWCYGLPMVRRAGLIRYKLVVHAFIDGKTRFVTGARVHSNNRGSTVLRLFHKARREYGTPRRMRGDHGTENIAVAQWMDENCGVGSYIWGMCVLDWLLCRYLVLYFHAGVSITPGLSGCGVTSLAGLGQSGRHSSWTLKCTMDCSLICPHTSGCCIGFFSMPSMKMSRNGRRLGTIILSRLQGQLLGALGIFSFSASHKMVSED